MENKASAKQAGLRVLIVEDNTDLAESIRFCVEVLESKLDKSIKVETVETGEAAQELLGENSYNLTILDLNLPDMNGYRVYEENLKDSGCATIILSGALSAVNPDCTNDNLVYLEKPASPAKLERHFKILLKDSI